MRDLVQDDIGFGIAVERRAVPVEARPGSRRMDLHAAGARQRQRLAAMRFGGLALGPLGRGRADAGEGGARRRIGKPRRETVERGIEKLGRYRRQDHQSPEVMGLRRNIGVADRAWTRSDAPLLCAETRMIGETAVQFGVFDHLDDSGLPLARHFENRLRLIEAYDRAGFYAYHLAEHHNTPLGYAPSPSVFLAAVAQRTKQLKFGPMVYLLPLYHPLRLIDEVCMLDQMSEGRFLYGVGRGISPIEVGFYGVDFATGAEQFREAFEVTRIGLTEDELTFHGKYLRFRPRADRHEADAEALSRAVVRHLAAGQHPVGGRARRPYRDLARQRGGARDHRSVQGRNGGSAAVPRPICRRWASTGTSSSPRPRRRRARWRGAATVPGGGTWSGCGRPTACRFR